MGTCWEMLFDLARETSSLTVWGQHEVMCLIGGYWQSTLLPEAQCSVRPALYAYELSRRGRFHFRAATVVAWKPCLKRDWRYNHYDAEPCHTTWFQDFSLSVTQTLVLCSFRVTVERRYCQRKWKTLERSVPGFSRFPSPDRFCCRMTTCGQT